MSDSSSSIYKHICNVRKSIEINQNKYGYSDDIKILLINTASMLEFEENK